MSTKKLIKALGLIIVVALLAAVLPQQAKAQEGAQTLNVAEWTGPNTVTNVKGRETVLKDVDTYHMWYSSPDETKLYHTYSSDPASFTGVEECEFPAGKPIELGSVSVIKEGDFFYMVAYGPTDKTSFAIYISLDKGKTWKDIGVIFSGVTEFEKIDGPFLFVEDADAFHYRLYFQAKHEDKYKIYVAESKGTKLENPPTFELVGLPHEPVLSPGGTGTWDGGFVMQPWVVKADKTYYMWYSAHNGTDPQRIGMAKSEDGINWVKSPGNPIFDPATGYAEPSVITDGETWQMWTMGTGGVINYLTATGPFEFQSIQAAIDAASTGDTIFIHAGTYVENPVLNATLNPNKQLNFIGKVDDEGKPLPLIKGTLNIDLPFADNNWSIENIKFEVTSSNHTLNLKNVNGLTIRNCEFDGAELFASGKNGINIESGPNGNNLTVEDSVFKNGLYVGINGYVNSLAVINCSFDEVKSGVNIQGAGGNTVTVEDSNFSVIAQGATNDTYGVRFASSGANTGGNLTITNSSFVVNKNGFVAGSGTYHSAIIIRAGATGALKVENSSILGEVVNQATSNTLDASPNWWGSVAGAGASQISGPVDFTPWCTNEGCTTFAPDASGNVNLSGEVPAVPGGILINEPNITYNLAANTIIQNESPCFVINASGTKIYAEPGAVCIPTGGANGIDVAAGLTDIRVAKLEIDGTGQSTGDGINFAGVVNGVVLADNKIHDLGGDGVEFVESPTGTVDIHGNLFAFNDGVGINNSDTTSPTSVAAEYNSWGSYYGPTGEGGDGVSGNVTFDPWTHADITVAPVISNTTSRVVTTLANVSGRPTVLKDGNFYHMWYGPDDTHLYHTSSTNPAEFPAGTLVTFTGGTPAEVASPAIIKEGESFYMVAYGSVNTKFALYSSTNGTAWSYVSDVFDGSGKFGSDFVKVDAPFLLNTGAGYRLYFQVKTGSGATERYNIYAAESSTIGGTYALVDGVNPVLSPATDTAAWDGKYVMHPWVVKDDVTGTYYMWYSAHNDVKPHQIGLATSTDGLQWTKSALNPVNGPVGEPAVINDNGIWRIWYLGAGNTVKYQSALSPLDLRQTLAYQVTANLQNVIGADVTLNFPKDLLSIAEITPGTAFNSAAFITATDGSIQFIGSKLSEPVVPVTGENLVLFTAAFHTDTQGSGDITFGPATFGMPGAGSSSNVYLAASADTASAQVNELPTLATTFGDAYYLVGDAQTFEVVITNKGTAYTNAELRLGVPADVSLTLTTSGYTLSGGVVALGQLDANETVTLDFSATISSAGAKTISFDVYDGAAPGGLLLFSTIETATVYTPPTLNSTDIQGYYLSGEQREFSVVLTNPSTGGNFAHVYVNYTIAGADMDEIDTIEYSVDHTNWVALGAPGSGTSYGEDGSGNIVGFFGQITGGGFPMAPDSSQTTWFRVTFKTREQGTTDYPTSYAISMQLMDADFTPDRQLTDFSETANVYDKPTITSDDIAGPYLAGVSREFHVTAENPATGGNFAHVLFNYRITNAVIADIAQFQYKAGDQWFNMPLEQDGLDLVGYFGPSSGFPMGPSYNATTTFRITFKTVKSYPFTLTLNDLDASSEELAKLEATAIVNGNFAITGTFTMQGNLNRGGIPVALTWTGTGWEYSESDTTEDLMANNFQVTVTYGGGYLITTNQPRYLNLTTASNRTITVDGVETLAALMLRGGNVMNTGTSLDKIDVSDAGLIGGVYGSSGDPSLIPADANFDGRVNILDLALVGGNYLMESADAYDGWLPLP